MSDLENEGENVTIEEPKTVYVRVADKDINIDFTSGDYVKLEGSGAYAFVRKAFASFVKQSTEGEEDKELRPAKPSKAVRVTYVPVLAVRFIGTSAYVAISTSVNGEEVVEHAQYVRPIAQHAPAIMRALGVLRGLNEQGIPWTAVVVAYVPGKPAKVLFVKSIRAYYKRYKTKSGVKLYPEVRFLFTKDMFGNLRKRTGYAFDFIVFALQEQQVQQKPAKAKAEADTEAEAVTEEKEGTKAEAVTEAEPKKKEAKKAKPAGRLQNIMLPLGFPEIRIVPVPEGSTPDQVPSAELTPSSTGGSSIGSGSSTSGSSTSGSAEGQQQGFSYVYESVGKYTKRQVEPGSIELEPEDSVQETYLRETIELGTSRYVQKVDSEGSAVASGIEKLRESMRHVKT